jgi:hypothetical protein
LEHDALDANGGGFVDVQHVDSFERGIMTKCDVGDLKKSEE